MLTEILILIALMVGWLQYYTQKRPPNFPPGPIGIPGFGYTPFLQLPIHKGFAQLSKKYGNIFSVPMGNIPVVVLNEWKMVRDAFRDERFAGRPPLHFFESRSWGKQRGVIWSTEKIHTEQRRFMLKTLKDLGLRKNSMEQLIMDEVIELISEFRKEINRPIALESRFIMAVLNAIWHIVAGERHSHDDPLYNKLLKALSAELDEAQPHGPFFFMPWYTKTFPKWSGMQSFLDAVYSTYICLEECVKSHKKTFDPDNPRDLIDVYLKEIYRTADPNSSFFGDEGEKQLLVVLLDIFSAGGDTISTTLGWILLYLINYPEIQTKVQAEIDSVIGKSRLPSLMDQAKMPYTEAVIAESMRMSSIFGVGIGVLHSITETLQFYGYTIPQGTIVLCNFWSIHHSKEHWGDPENYRPERFLDQDGNFRKDEALMPFSMGKRVCPGESLARDEIFLFLTALLQQFDFECDPESSLPTTDPKTAIISKAQPHKVIIKERS